MTEGWGHVSWTHHKQACQKGNVEAELSMVGVLFFGVIDQHQ